MSTKLIIYDLNTPGQDYDALITEIQSLGAWWHYLDSTWLVKSTLTVSAISTRLRNHMDKNDELLVVDVTGDARAWSGFVARASDWLNDTWD